MVLILNLNFQKDLTFKKLVQLLFLWARSPYHREFVVLFFLDESEEQLLKFTPG